MNLSVVTISMEKSNTSGWAWKLDQWVKKNQYSERDNNAT